MVIATGFLPILPLRLRISPDDFRTLRKQNQNCDSRRRGCNTVMVLPDCKRFWQSALQVSVWQVRRRLVSIVDERAETIDRPASRQDLNKRPSPRPRFLSRTPKNRQSKSRKLGSGQPPSMLRPTTLRPTARSSLRKVRSWSRQRAISSNLSSKRWGWKSYYMSVFSCGSSEARRWSS